MDHFIDFKKTEPGYLKKIIDLALDVKK